MNASPKSPDAVALGAGEPGVTVTMLSQPRYLASARGAISAFAKQAGFDDSACSHIALAVDEALCNVIRHGYDKREDGVIWLKCWPELERGEQVGVRIQIEDRAKQVDPGLIKSRDLSDIRPGGLGVHIIKEVMDSVRYEPREDGGMRLTLVRLLPSAGSRVTFGQRSGAANGETMGGSSSDSCGCGSDSCGDNKP